MTESPLSPPTTPQRPEIWENLDDYESDDEETESGSCASLSLPTKPGTSPVWPRKPSAVMPEGYVDGSNSSDGRSDGSVARTKSLTDDDLKELKGCLDLGFGFSYEEIPELCNTLPALELCYSMSQRFLDEKRLDGGVTLLQARALLLPVRLLPIGGFLSLVGLTKVFLRAGQMAELDAVRKEVLGRYANKIQRKVRTHQGRKKIILVLSSAVNFQPICRGSSGSSHM